MPDSDDDSDFAEYGTALEPIEEDEVTRKRPITVAEQIAVDEKGRRRFHGAFTGGFSAGYFNTVGSKEGWTPSTFKSSRSDRASGRSQNVLDFMDEEDKGAFGIAPQVLRPTDDFTDKSESRGKKRPWQKSSEGPIPGVPVLEQIIQPVKETIGIRILVKMGWRPGKGVGPKMQRKAKRAKYSIQEEEDETDKPQVIEDETEIGSTEGKVYGCFIPPEFMKQKGEPEESSDEDIDAEKLLAPDDVNELLCNPKENVFGLGYKGLDRNTLTPAAGHVDLFGSKLKFRVENKKMSISGEAFGVGAFEENDDDIYSREDMSQYDFALETPEERRKRKAKEEQDKRKSKIKDNCIEGFRIASGSKLRRKTYPPPPLPPNFQPFHVVKKSRFEGSGSTSVPEDDGTEKGLGRHNLRISERQVLLEEDINKIAPKDTKSKAVEEPEETGKNEKGPSTVDVPVPKPETDEDIQKRIEKLKKFTQVLQAYSSTKEEEMTDKPAFKPFMKNPEKQERYEKYLTLVKAGFSECLKDLQPPEMTEWERDREKMEFERASKLYKPMNNILASRFTSAKSHDISHLEPEKEVTQEKDPKDDPKVAARLKLFGKLTHRVLEWHPDKLVCKRFNVPHPYPDSKFVGVKGDASLFVRSSKSKSSSDQNVPTSIVPGAPPPVKKSLFDNLDFSKPPPGLLPAGTSSNDEANKSEGERDGREINRSVLEFQKELTQPQDEENNKAMEVDSLETERPPLDLFREIFADSSDSDDNEEETGASSETKHESHQRPSEDNLGLQKEISSASSKPAGSKQPLLDNEADDSNKSSKRGVFDRIDLDKMRLHKPVGEEKSQPEEEEAEDLYGPMPPKCPSSSTKSSSSKAAPSSGRILFNKSVSSTVGRSLNEPNLDDVVWVEKSAVKDESKSKKHSSKKSKRKKDKRKSHKKEKKRKKKSRKSNKSRRNESTDSSDSDSDSDASSDSSITLNKSLNIKALQEKLKRMTKP